MEWLGTLITTLGGAAFLLIPICCLFPAGVFILGMLVRWYHNRDRHTIIATAIATERRHVENGTYDIWTVRLEDGSPQMLINQANIFLGKSEHKTVLLQQSFQKGAKYKIVVAGGKRSSEWFFQNIVTAEKLVGEGVQNE